MTRLRRITLVLIATVFLGGLPACSSGQAQKKVDKAGNKVGNAASKAADKAKSGAKKAKKAVDGQ
jgi:hypothetical protein